MICPRCYTEAQEGEETCRKCGYALSGFSRDYDNPYDFRDKDWNPYIGILHRVEIEEEPEETASEADQPEEKTSEKASETKPSGEKTQEKQPSKEKTPEKKASGEKTPEKKSRRYKAPEEKTSEYHLSGESITQDQIFLNNKVEKSIVPDEKEAFDDILNLLLDEQGKEKNEKEKETGTKQTKAVTESTGMKDQNKQDSGGKKTGSSIWKKLVIFLLILAGAYAGAYYTGNLSRIPFISELPLPDLPEIHPDQIPILSELLKKKEGTSQTTAENPTEEPSEDTEFVLSDETEFDPDAEYSVTVLDTTDPIHEENRITELQASASSTLQSTKASYDPICAFDYNTATNWQEGVQGSGIGESLTVDFPDTEEIRYLTFSLGSWKYDSNSYTTSYYENNRPKQITIEMNGFQSTLEFPDDPYEYAIEISPVCRTSFVTFTIDDVYSGSKYNDTVITDIGLYRE